MEQHLIEDGVWQRMLAALKTLPYMHCGDPDRLRHFVCACFVVMRTNLTWVELRMRHKITASFPRFRGLMV